MVELVELGGEQFLWYKAPRIDVALIRGTTADTEGNVTFEKEAFYGDALNMVRDPWHGLPRSILPF